MKIDLSAKMGVSGCFKKIEVLDGRGNVKRTVEGPRNLILNTGLSRLSQISSYGDTPLFTHCRVGTGTSEPNLADTNLDNQIASSHWSSNGFTQGVNLVEGYCWARQVYSFGVGDVVGNVSELATGWAAFGANTLFSRALVRDGEGNPTSITVLSDEILRVTWEHRRYWPQLDATGTIENSGNKGGEYEWTLRSAFVGSWRVGIPVYSTLPFYLNTGSQNYDLMYWPSPATLGSVSGGPSGARGLRDISVNRSSIGNGTRGRLSWLPAQGNAEEGIKCIKFAAGTPSGDQGSQSIFQVEFDPPFLKTENDVLEIDLDITWANV